MLSRKKMTAVLALTFVPALYACGAPPSGGTETVAPATGVSSKVAAEGSGKVKPMDLPVTSGGCDLYEDPECVGTGYDQGGGGNGGGGGGGSDAQLAACLAACRQAMRASPLPPDNPEAWCQNWCEVQIGH
jgi:hypothetical protein